MSVPWLKFYPSDWRADPALRMCSIAARGLWMEMLCIMHEAAPRGSLLINGNPVSERQLASLAGVSAPEAKRLMAELEAAGVFSREEEIVVSRRMRRDTEKAEADKANGLKGGHPDIRRGTVPKEQRVRRFRRSDAPAKAQRIFDRTDGCCHWCKNTLDPENYHIDHLVAVRDGGTNDEENLAASCPDCNGERAMTWGRSDTDLMVGNKSDHKAQKPETRSQTSPESSNELSDLPDHFEEFWQARPRREGDDPKKTASLAYDRALKRGGTEDGLLAAVRRHAAKHPQPTRFIPQLVTWLNEDRWRDEEAAANETAVAVPVEWIRVDDPRWHDLAARHEREKGTRPGGYLSQHAEGRGFHFPTHWINDLKEQENAA